MGLKIVRGLVWSFLLSFPGLLSGPQSAAPVLRLVGSAIGPISVTPGSSGSTQTVEAFNIGDGSLSLTVASSVSWIVTTIGATRNCTTTTQVSSCVPVQMGLNTQGLAAGTFTGIVRVNDPNAIDAPQTITVTVRVGGIDLYVAPGTSRDTSIATTSMVTTRTTTQDGGGWLSVALDGTASFRFSFPYRVRLQAAASQPAGAYTGSIVTSGSNAASDNLTIPVTMRVAVQAIAEASPDQISIRVATGAPALTREIVLKNMGTGFFFGVTATATGGAWLTATGLSSGAQLTIDPGALAPGAYSGVVTIASNAVNSTVAVPVELEVVAKGPPVIDYQGVQDNGTFVPGDTVAAGDIMVVKGDQLSFSPVTLSPPPLATQIGGASVLVNGQRVPMYYSTYGQLAFQMPVNTPSGRALVQVERDGVLSNTMSVTVAARAPRLLLVREGIPAIVNAADGSIPVAVGALPGYAAGTHPAKPGDTLLIYAIGMGPTSPAVGTGAASPGAEPLARLTVTPQVYFGSSIAAIPVTPIFAGLAPTYVGEYQINVTIPADVPKGTVNVAVGFPDSISNAVPIVIQ